MRANSIRPNRWLRRLSADDHAKLDAIHGAIDRDIASRVRQAVSEPKPALVKAKKKQRGFIHISTTDVVVFLTLFGLVFGFVFYVVLPWLWSLIKPLLHSLTA